MLGLGLYTQMPSSMSDFYSQFPGVKLHSSSGDRCELRIGQTQLSFEKKDAFTSPFYYWCITAIPDCFHDILANLPLSSNIVVDNRDQGLVRITDPAANIIDLQRGKPNPLRSDYALYISRIGLVTADVETDIQLFRNYLEPVIGSMDRIKNMLRSQVDGSELMFIQHDSQLLPSGVTAKTYPLRATIQGPISGSISVLHLPYYIDINKS